jgi:hypothetical protein
MGASRMEATPVPSFRLAAWRYASGAVTLAK